jgi:electron transfer DM13
MSGDLIMNKRALVVVVGIAVIVAGWALFRPELLFIDKTVNETLPSAAQAATAVPVPDDTIPLLAGNFHNGAHETRGTATILQLRGGKRVLRLTNFETSNGPDVRILLITATDASDNDTVKNSMPREIAPLKGNIGAQNYDIPDDVDLSRYKAVTIWCHRFSVNFGTAPLSPSS